MNPPDARLIRLLMELRLGGVTDHRVLAALESVPREQFLSGPFKDQAYDNAALPIAKGQTISQPLVVARMTQALELTDRMKVLEIGTGSGYQALILAKLCRRLYSIERHKELLDEAEARFQAMRVNNITARVGDGAKGWPEQAPFDRILVTCAAPAIPEALVDQLAEGGIMVAPIGADAADQEVVRLVKNADGIRLDSLFPVRFVPLVGGKPG